ncbi:MAG: DUF488 domain-containing protein [Lentisphaeria bacterium]|jgi:uncharacterized protein (DUF488 family)
MIYTIGHSTMSSEDFVKIAAPLKTVIDIRSHPTSRWEQFRKEEMQRWLQNAGIGYEWWPSLGGWSEKHADLIPKFEPLLVDVAAYVRGKFPKQRIAKGTKCPEPSENIQESLPGIRPAWTNQGLYDYSWFMSLPEFIQGAEELIQRGESEDIGIMCCEVLWWKCHRSMVADYVVFRKHEVFHLQPKLSSHTKAIGNRLDRYDPRIIEAWNK